MKRIKRHIAIYIALLIVVVGIIIWLRPKSDYRPSTFEEIEADGVLRIVTDYTPLSYYLQGDSLSGFDYELARMIGQRSGLALEITPEVNLSKSIEGLKTGKYDIIARQLPVTSEIKEDLAFTVPIQLNKQVLVQLKESKGFKKLIRNQLDLAGETLYIVSDAPTRLRINNLAREIGACYAGLYYVVNYGEGIRKSLSHDELEDIFYDDAPMISRILLDTIRSLATKDRECECLSLRKETLLKGIYDD